MRRVAVISVGRSDYGLLRPLLRAIESADDLQLQLIAGAAHLAGQWGHTVREIEADGFAIAARIDCNLANDSHGAVVRTMGLAMLECAAAFERLAPDIAIVLGDRSEMFAAAAATVPFQIPLAHLCGGSVTQGAIDDVYRHGISKMAHWHFVETEDARNRLLRMGEANRRIHVTGLIGLDNIAHYPALSPAEIASRFGLRIDPADRPLLITFHPVTRKAGSALAEFEALLAAVARSGHPAIFTYPNADAESVALIARLEQFVAATPRAQVVKHLGTEGYYAVLREARAMVGNSSSGLLESASFKLPVVNVGDRQKGRLAPPNVISVPAEASAIAEAIATVTSEPFRHGLSTLVNPYGDGNAAGRIMSVLRATPLDRGWIVKEAP
ncbi:MAG: UDP-N-acetylglucosamine 2-epimerase [Hyphomicrobiaceae bacterium]|nr:UDP-N-acetylglucosamine 2-epimerase [Hyphomicrobiaceae bacterium]